MNLSGINHVRLARIILTMKEDTRIEILQGYIDGHEGRTNPDVCRYQEAAMLVAQGRGGRGKRHKAEGVVYGNKRSALQALG